MKVYIDLLFILNFIYDFILLMTVSITLKRNIKLNRLLLSSFYGALTIFIIFIPINKMFLLIIKILLGILMVIICFGYKNIKYTIDNIKYLYMCSVILAGFLYFLKTEFNNLSYVIVLIISPLILCLYIKQNKKLKETVNYYKNITIVFKNNESIKLVGFIDSGNKLKDPVTKKYIILINKKLVKGIYNIRSPMYVIINTINKKSLLECVPITKLIIDNKEYTNYLLGLTDSSFNDFDCLLNYHIMEE